MKIILLVVIAFVFSASAAFAQTVAPGTTPGATTGNPTNMPSAGSDTDHNTSDKMSGDGRMNNAAGRRMRGNKRMSKDGTMKMKTKTDADGTMKTKM